MNPAILPWLAEILTITYRTMTGQRFTVTRVGASGPFGLAVQKTSGAPNRPPLPSELLSTFIIFGTYAAIGESSNPATKRVAGLLGWGTLLATILMLAQGGTPAPSQSGTFPPGPTLSQRNQLVKPLPGTTNFPGGQF